MAHITEVSSQNILFQVTPQCLTMKTKDGTTPTGLQRKTDILLSPYTVNTVFSTRKNYEFLYRGLTMV